MATINDYLTSDKLVDRVRSAKWDEESISLEKKRVHAGIELNVSMGMLSMLENLDNAFATIINLSGSDAGRALASIASMMEEVTSKLGAKINDEMIPAAEALGLDRHAETEESDE